VVVTSTVSSEQFLERRVWGGRLWVRRGWEERLPLNGESLEAGFRAHPDVTSYRGRGAVWSVPAGRGERAVLRHYRHGGVLAPLTRDVFVGRTPRPVAELSVSEELRRRGLRTPEVLAVFWKSAGPLMYRADLVTREVQGGQDLAAWLAVKRTAKERKRVLGAVGAMVAELHAQGLHHPDLNMKNLLVRDGEVWILDLDRARIGDPLNTKDRERQVERLARSFRKLGFEADFAGVRKGYAP
jgi:3-deoxy-D-manno-octulosonic acid kinase